MYNFGQGYPCPSNDPMNTSTNQQPRCPQSNCQAPLGPPYNSQSYQLGTWFAPPMLPITFQHNPLMLSHQPVIVPQQAPPQVPNQSESHSNQPSLSETSEPGHNLPPKTKPSKKPAPKELPPHTPVLISKGKINTYLWNITTDYIFNQVNRKSHLARLLGNVPDPTGILDSFYIEVRKLFHKRWRLSKTSFKKLLKKNPDHTNHLRIFAILAVYYLNIGLPKRIPSAQILTTEEKQMCMKYAQDVSKFYKQFIT